LVKPYRDDQLTDNSWIRFFKADVDDSELVWHRDSATREILVGYGNGWEFQFENQLPFELIEGQKFTIEKMSYHRLIKGNGDLCIRITEIDD
jgi:hypothetical protein